MVKGGNLLFSNCVRCNDYCAPTTRQMCFKCDMIVSAQESLDDGTEWPIDYPCGCHYQFDTDIHKFMMYHKLCKRHQAKFDMVCSRKRREKRID